MNSNERGRGRPIGTGYNDAPILEKMADLMVAQPTLKATTAMRRILGQPGPSQIRRLQVKWKEGAAEFLAAAQARRAVTPTPARRISASQSPRTVRQIMEASRRVQEMMHSIRAAQELMNTPGMLAAQEAARLFYDSPAAQAMGAFHDSPAARAMREFQDSPTARAMREMQDSPTMRAAREGAQTVASLQHLISGGGF
jgi:hypothetical protein